MSDGSGARGPIDRGLLAAARQALASASGKRRLDLILDQPDPGALVRSLPADDLYFTIRDIGLGDAVELVQLATPNQFRIFLDLDCWSHDRVDPRRALPWIRAARSGSMESPKAEARWRAKLTRIDIELLSLVFRETLRIHDLEADPDPHVESDRFMRSPEGKLLVEFVAEGTEYAAVRGIVDDLYAESPFHAARILSSIQWESPTELEESELRWRTARMADLGYPSLQEALSWFARPAGAPAPPAGTPPARPPGFFLQRVGTGSLLARSAHGLDSSEREHLELELVSASNAVLVAEGIDPADIEAVRRSVEVGRAFVEMGLGVLASGDDARAVTILATTAVKALFQLGFERVLKLAWRAARLFEGGRAGSRASPLLDPPLGEMLSALTGKRPRYYPGLDLPRAEWGSVAAGGFDPRGFMTEAEVARTDEALGLAEELVALADRLGLAPARMEGPTAPHLSTLYLTALANERLGGPFAPIPIARGDLAAAAAALSESVDDPRLDGSGEPGRVLRDLALVRVEELKVKADGVGPEHLSSLIVER